MQDDIVQDVINAFDKAGLWQDGLELIGSWCFFMYQKHLGVKTVPLKTVDVDFLIPRPYLSTKVLDLEPVLKSIGFERQHNSDGSVFFQHPDLKLEFLTPESGKGDEKPPCVKQLGLNAISLRFLHMLFDDPIRLTHGGVAINVPNPRDYCLHKLIIGQRRRNEAKRAKDIEHAVYVLPTWTSIKPSRPWPPIRQNGAAISRPASVKPKPSCPRNPSSSISSWAASNKRRADSPGAAQKKTAAGVRRLAVFRHHPNQIPTGINPFPTGRSYSFLLRTSIFGLL
jgi:hypothetical protein